MKKLTSLIFVLLVFSACTDTSPDIEYTDQSAYIENETSDTIYISYSTENQVFEDSNSNQLKILSSIKSDSVSLGKHNNDWYGGPDHKILDHVSLGSQIAMTSDELNSKIHYLNIYKIVDGNILKANIDLTAYKAWNKTRPWDDNRRARTRKFYFYVTDELFE
ncbi:hypothetical protein [Roseivirga echinicomitans]|uniref:PLAT domain-containing protein n=1 Tax=Roseivirga echinicomitans TaxID=296218 RepID=A0A150XPS3_9BACT|nr:hypothetical protein [Roseivirga echinicomitans]KYG80749.1 hypothetical protein AWN68_16715 [Roseivirga echinicomitans]